MFSSFKFYCPVKSYPFSKLQVLGSSKLKVFADDNFEFDKNDKNLSKWVQAISPFPTVFL